MATIVSGPSEEQKRIFALHGQNLDGSPIARETTGGSGSKGGGKRDYDLTDPRQREGFLEARAKYNTDNSYGYYGDDGKYVGFFQDATDGGGMNTTDTFFKGGPLSTLLNVAKVRPAGMSREKNEAGEFLVPRADIGFRDATDMFDRGGPQTSGGQFQGGGKISKIGNFVDFLAGREATKPIRYEPTGTYPMSNSLDALRTANGQANGNRDRLEEEILRLMQGRR